MPASDTATIAALPKPVLSAAELPATAAATTAAADPLRPLDTFARRHLGSSPAEIARMLDLVGYPTLDALVDAAVPENIRLRRPLALPAALSESEALDELRGIAARNQVFRSYLGSGYSGTLTPGVIQRNILENPGWYTAYTPYQAEIAQGRLEALINFQTMVCDLTGLDIANASLLDEGTAAAEAMALAYAVRGQRGQARGVLRVGNLPSADDCRRADARPCPLGIEVVVGDHANAAIDDKFFGALVQYPATDGTIFDYAAFVETVHAAGRWRWSRPTRWRCACCARRASSARTWPWAARSVSACRWATADRTRRTSR